MGKFGKNDWKIKAYYAVSGIVVLGVIGGLAVNAPKLLSKLERSKQEIEKVQTEETKPVVKENEEHEVMENTPIAEPTDTPTPEPVSVSLLAEEPKMNEGYYKVSVVEANASSTISQQGTDNGPMLLFDGRDDTTWQEGVNGYGINESLFFSFEGSNKIKYIGFKLGNWKNDKYYFGNAMPKTMTLSLGDYSGQVTFNGVRDIEWVEVSRAVSADSMRMVIDDVYPGTSWEDTCITEIMIYAEH